MELKGNRRGGIKSSGKYDRKEWEWMRKDKEGLRF